MSMEDPTFSVFDGHAISVGRLSAESERSFVVPPADETTFKPPSVLFRAALFTFAFVTGCQETLPEVPVTKLLMDKYHFQPTRLGSLFASFNLVWIAVPLIGFMSDAYPVFNQRRRPHLAFAMLICVAVWSFLAFVEQSKYEVGVVESALMLNSFAVVYNEVAINSLLVESARHESEEDSGKLQSAYWMAKAFGMTCGSCFGGRALSHDGPDHPYATVFAGLALVSLIGACTVPLMKEEHIGQGHDSRSVSLHTRLSVMSEFWRTTEVQKLAAFVLLQLSMPTARDTFVFFMRDKLHLSMEVIADLGIVKSVLTLGATFAFHRSLRHLPIRSVVILSIILLSVLQLADIIVVRQWNQALSIPNECMVMGGMLGNAIGKELFEMPLNVLSARISPPGTEGVAYSTFMTTWNLGEFLSGKLGAMLTSSLDITVTHFDNMWILILITSLAALFPYVGLGLIPMHAGHVEPGVPSPNPTDDTDLEIGCPLPPISPRSCDSTEATVTSSQSLSPTSEEESAAATGYVAVPPILSPQASYLTGHMENPSSSHELISLAASEVPTATPGDVSRLPSMP